jgi:protein-S-isoprenylcysteine O-methyltransferase Ste14
MTAESALATRTEWPLRLSNCVATGAVIVVALGFHHISKRNRFFLDYTYELLGLKYTGAEFLFTAAALYALLVGVYYFAMPDPGVSKSLRFWQLAAAFARNPVLVVRAGLTREDRTAVLATLLKALFGPLMIMALMTATAGLIMNVADILATDLSTLTLRAFYDRQGHWLLFRLIVMADVFFFTVGYLVELPRLGNQIRSVDPTLLGWAAALVCYAPFNAVLGFFLGSPGSEFPRFENDTVHYVLNGTLLALMAIYTSASVALGLKASNLTHRGIVTSGPYRFVRHPAYACKNMAWWIGSIPFVAASFAESTLSGTQAVANVIGWSMLYILRAVTEEDHLKSVDGDYAAYAAKVRYRFIPGVI